MNFALKDESQLSWHSRNQLTRRNYGESHAEASKGPPSSARTPQASQSSPSISTPPRPGIAAESRTQARAPLPARENPYGRPNTLKCFRCFQPEHKSNECPSRQQIQLMDGEHPLTEGDSAAGEPDSEDGFEDVHGDSDDPVVCVIQKLLLAPRGPTHSQRNALFKMHCTIQGKVCEVLVDSGCTENVISRTVV
ncbi:uncharacterized protein LOC114579175 [Dendrobium catenatum]|uniref:uncharacterized protein LOC114579175 n=1 Tax=Dendrobium catenatum TaxID=906689 RepID=UPI00109F1407|nr:uncharacterized protein LOC114579175 [Dendrobium catenatum]